MSTFRLDPTTDPLAFFESERDLNRDPLSVDAAASAPVKMSALVEDVTAAATSQSEWGNFEQPSLVTPGRDPIPLNHVLDRLGRVEWLEAVAIVHVLSGQLNDGNSRPRVPELSQASITAEGGVHIDRGAATDMPGPPFARMLHALTANGPVPPAVRLFITKWISWGETHSIADFAAELAYFARPDSASLIRAVYERAAAAPVPAKPQPKAVVEEKPPAPVKPPPRRGRQLPWVAALAAGLAAALAALLAGRAATSPPGESSTSFATFVSDGARQLGAVAAGVGDYIGLSAIPGVASAKSASAPAAAAPADATRPSGRASRPAAGSRTVRVTPGRSAGQSAQLPQVVLAPPPRVEPVAPIAPSDIDISVNGAPERIDAPPDVSDVYSSADVDVTPPALRFPQLPLPLLRGGGELNTIELIVSAAGRVERVKLLSPPIRMADMMLLSGAKTWVFEPASKLGQPVRYRLVLSWDATP